MSPLVAALEALQTAIVVGGCVYALLRVVRAAEPLLARYMGLREETARRGPGKVVALPPDLEAFVARETEQWAQESTRAWLAESYEKLGNWDQVRRLAVERNT